MSAITVRRVLAAFGQRGWLFNQNSVKISPYYSILRKSNLQCYTAAVRLSSSLTKSHDNENNDILYDQLTKANGALRILELVSLHHDVMNNKHLLAAFDVIQSNFKTISAEELTNNHLFELLCKQAVLRARYFDLPETISMLKHLTRLPVSPSSRIVQSYLQMLKGKMNDLTLTHIPFISFLIDKFQKREVTPLAEALKLALPLVMELNMNSQIDELGAKVLIDCFSFSVFNQLNQNVTQKFIFAILRKKHLIREYADAFRLFGILGKLRTDQNGFDELFQVVVDILIQKIHKLPIPHALSALITCDKRYLHFSKFFDAIAKRMIQEEWEMWHVSAVLSTFINIRYINVECLDAIGEMVLKNKTIVNEDPRVSIFNFVEMFALSNCSPANAEQVFDVLSSSDKKLNELKLNSPHMMLTLLCNFVTLQHYPRPLIEMVMNQRFLSIVSNEFLKPARLKAAYDKLLLIEQTLSVNGVCENLLSKEFVHKAITHCSKYKAPRNELEDAFASALEQGLGGSQYALSDVWTKSGMCIDHLIVMRGGKYPMAINNLSESDECSKVCYVEDLALPMDVKLVAVLPVNEYSYASNLPRVRSTVACSINNLEKLGYATTVIHLIQWNELLESERIPYLMRAVHEAVPSVSTSSVNFNSSN